MTAVAANPFTLAYVSHWLGHVLLLISFLCCPSGFFFMNIPSQRSVHCRLHNTFILKSAIFLFSSWNMTVRSFTCLLMSVLWLQFDVIAGSCFQSHKTHQTVHVGNNIKTMSSTDQVVCVKTIFMSLKQLGWSHVELRWSISFPRWQTLILCQYLRCCQTRQVWTFATGKDASGYEVIVLQSAECFRLGGKDTDRRWMSCSGCGMRSGLRPQFTRLLLSWQQEK